jgi:LysR family hydrogen peroxide-inducible transcriptional activator
VEHEHFARAAEACNVSPSAFSVAIQELEQQLGVQLVDRSRRQVTITQHGRDVAEQADLILRDLEQLTRMASARQQRLSGRLNLGVIPTVAPFVLPAWLPQLKNDYPDLKLFFREVRTDPLLAELASGDLDLGLLALPYSTRNLTTMKLFRDPFLLACREDTALIDPERFSLNRITAESVLLLEEGHCLREHALQACRIDDLEAVNRFAATSLLTLLAMVDEDLGITFLPEMAVGSSLLAETRIETYPLKRRAHREIAMVWRKSTSRADEFEELGRHLCDAIGKAG